MKNVIELLGGTADQTEITLPRTEFETTIAKPDFPTYLRNAMQEVLTASEKVAVDEITGAPLSGWSKATVTYRIEEGMNHTLSIDGENAPNGAFFEFSFSTDLGNTTTSNNFMDMDREAASWTLFQCVRDNYGVRSTEIDNRASGQSSRGSAPGGVE